MRFTIDDKHHHRHHIRLIMAVRRSNAISSKQ